MSKEQFKEFIKDKPYLVDYIDDGSRSTENVIQVEFSNHSKVLYSKDMVLSVREKATIKLSGKYYGDE